MRLTAIFLLTACLSAGARGYSQRVTLSAKNERLEAVFKKIEKQTGYNFLYQTEWMSRAKRVDIAIRDASLEQALDLCFRDQPFNYAIVDKVIVVKEKNTVAIPPRVEISQSIPFKEILGIITDSAGAPLAGATIKVKGTDRGTSSNNQGEFKIDAVPGNILTITFSGYQPFEVKVEDNGKPLMVVLRRSYADIGGVVVIGYGTQQKSKVSAAMASVNTKKIENQLNASIDRSLEGQVSGVVVKQNTGAPGGGAAIKVRGGGSLGSGDDPLFVVDGVPYSNTFGKEYSPLAFINPSDIESIDILKDAAASSIYGSRGANGVVLITTKSGKLGKTEITVDVRTGIQQVLPAEKLDLMNAYEYTNFRKESYLQYQEYYGLPVNLNDLPASVRDPEFWKGRGFDWQEGLFRNAPVQSYNISISHGSEHFKGYYSLRYTHDEGAIIETSFKKLNMRANMVYEPNEYMKLGADVSPTIIWWGNPAGDNRGANYGNAMIAPPTDGPYYDADYPNENPEYIFDGWDGDIWGEFLFHFSNPIYNLKNIKNKNNNLSVNIRPYLHVTPLKGLTLKTQFNLQSDNTFTSTFQPSTNITNFAPPPTLAIGTYTSGRSQNWQWENSISYQRNFGNHFISALAAYTAERYSTEFGTITAWNFPNDRVTTLDASGTQVAATAESAWSLLSTIFRLNYDYKSKYLLMGSFRRDGSSRFGSDRRWGYFPSISAGWNVTRESFFPQTTWINNLKIRASYGSTGNNNIGDYTWIALMARADHNFGGNIAPGSTPSGISNTGLGWEKTQETDIGLDLSLFGGSVDFTFDYYKKITSDMLWSVNIPISSGFNSMWDNLGKVQNQGMEFSIATKNITGKNFTWNTDLNIAFNRNKVLDLGNIDRIINTVGFGVKNITRVGEPMAQFWGYKLLGIFNTQEEIDKSATYGAQLPGTPHWEDLNGDGSIDERDMMVIGRPQPKFTGGLNNRFTYKNWDFIVNMSFAYDFDVAAALESTTMNLGGLFNMDREVLQRWQSPENPGNGRVSNSFVQTGLDRDIASSKFIYNVSYLKIQNISLGYTLNNWHKIKQCRLSLSVQNPWLITNYKYGNPDVNRYGSSSLMQGVDEYDYPLTRIVKFGVTVTL